MSDNVQTYTVNIPSVALAKMAWGLACTRRASVVLEGGPVRRAEAARDPFYDVSRMYYEIIDAIARGAKP